MGPILSLGPSFGLRYGTWDGHGFPLSKHGEPNLHRGLLAGVAVAGNGMEHRGVLPVENRVISVVTVNINIKLKNLCTLYKGRGQGHTTIPHRFQSRPQNSGFTLSLALYVPYDLTHVLCCTPSVLYTLFNMSLASFLWLNKYCCFTCIWR